MSNARNLARLLPNASGQLPDAAMASGSVLQVVSSFSATQVINNSGTFTDTGLTVSITPSSNINKVLVQASIPWQLGTNNGNGQLQFRLMRDSADLTSNLVFNNVSAIVQLSGTQILSWVDAPGSTGSVVYKIQFRELSMSGRYGSTAVMPILNAGQTGAIQAMEIAA